MKTMKKIGIIGSGVVGSAMGKGFHRLGHDVLFYDGSSSNNNNSNYTILSKKKKEKKKHAILHNRQSSIFQNRAISTFDCIKRRIWKDKWPLVTEVELKKTGPWVLKPNQYHNHTFWPWSTGIEMLARSKFGQYKECNVLFSKIA